MSQAVLTVEELLQFPVLQNARIVSGARGLRNQIQYVDVMEIPDLTGWLRNNEFVLTTGYAFQNNPQALCILLDEMHKVGGAVVGVKQRRFSYEINDEAVQKSEKFGIPIIDIPSELTTIDITHSVMEHILHRKFTVLRRARDINREFMQLILNRHGAEIVALIGTLLHSDVAVLNPNAVVLNATPGFQSESVTATRPVTVGNAVLGYMQLTTEPAEDDVFAQMCIDQALMGLALEFTMQNAVRYRNDHAREEFLMELLSGAPRAEDIIAYRARQLGLSINTHYYILVIKPHVAPTTDVESSLHNEVGEQIRLAVDSAKSQNCQFLVISLSEYFVFLCTVSPERAHWQYEEDHLMTLLQEQLQRKISHVDFFFGVGSVVDTLFQVHESYAQAHRAVDVGQKVFVERRVIRYTDIYVEDIVLQVGQYSALKMLYVSLLQPIAQYDKEKGTELLKTLEAFVRLGGNTKSVSEELFLHRNSITYRLDRIQAILKVDLTDPEIRLRLDLVLRAWKLQLFSIDVS
ncbi:transcriptional regulator [Ktedonobacteria bacterium brp13]|nr:transcriptional regulator [Ktedonobacteria bacterium brp13]